MKKKSIEWILKSIGFNKNTEHKLSFMDIPEPKVKIKSTKNGYVLLAKEDINRGDIIEICPSLSLHTSYEDLTKTPNSMDDVLFNYGVIDNRNIDEFEKEGHPIIIGLGNFCLYSNDSIGNAVYMHDPNFNVFIIRAHTHIEKDSPVILATTSSNESNNESKDSQSIDSSGDNNKKDKKMGCGCGKKKAQQPKQEEPKQEEPVKTDEVKSSKFKSMVDGKDLTSIKVD
jgi:hypothetical protein